MFCQIHEFVPDVLMLLRVVGVMFDVLDLLNKLNILRLPFLECFFLLVTYDMTSPEDPPFAPDLEHERLCQFLDLPYISF